jgi:hypothetical protein
VLLIEELEVAFFSHRWKPIFQSFEEAGSATHSRKPGHLLHAQSYVPFFVSNTYRGYLTMPLCRPRATSLQLSVERLRITTWRPARPPTPRRSTYPQPGTTTLDMTGIADSNIPPVPPLSYWEPETPSPMSPHNPFLSPPTVSPGSLRVVASPLLPASPLSVFDRQAAKSWSVAVPLRSPCAGLDLSPRFLNPRTPPLPPRRYPGTGTLQEEGSHSTMCSVSPGELDKLKHTPLYTMIVAFQVKMMEEMQTRKERTFTGRDKSWTHGYSTMQKRRERRKVVRMKGFRVLRQVDVQV